MSLTDDGEVLAAYSHSAQASNLQLCHTVALTSPVCAETEREASVEPARPFAGAQRPFLATTESSHTITEEARNMRTC
jgi:hypothetical protein